MIPLSEDFSKDTGKQLVTAIERDVRDRSNASRRSTVVRNMYSGNTARLDIHWDGASDIHLPLVAEKVDTTVPKWESALLDIDPVANLRRPPDDPYPEVVREQEQFLDWATRNDIPDFRLEVQNWIRNALLDPVGIIKIFWQHTRRNTVEIHRLKSMWQVGEVTFANFEVKDEPLTKAPEDLLIEVFGAPVEFVGQNGLVDFEEEEDGSFEVTFVEDRREFRNVRVEFGIGQFIDEVHVKVFREIVVHDNPTIEVVEFEDLIVPFRSKNIQTASRVTQQYWMRPSEIQQKVDSGEWRLSEQEMTAIRAQRTTIQEEMPENDRQKRQRDAAVGERGKHSGTQGLSPFSEGQVLMFEVYTLDDLNGDGIPEEVIYQIPYSIRRIVHAEYLDAVYPHGKRPFADARWRPVSGRYLGISQGEFLAPMQVQINTTINQVNDAQELINNPWFFYVPTALSTNTELLTNIQPGTGIPVGDTNGIMFPQWAQQPLANLSTGLDPILLFADRITVSPLQGGSTQVRNAPRTARATLAVLSEGNQGLDSVVKLHQAGGWTEMVHQILALYQYYMPDEKWFWVMGPNGNKRARVTHKQMRGRWELIFSGNTVNTNSEAQRILSQQRYQLAMTNPLYSSDPQAMQNILRDMLRNFSDGTDIEPMIPKLPGQGAFQHPPMEQKHENEVMKLGVSLDALPIDDHAQHIQVLDQLVASQVFDTMPREYVAIFAAHKRQHQQMMQAAINAQQQQAASGGGEQTVSPDAGLGNLEGGVQ